MIRIAESTAETETGQGQSPRQKWQPEPARYVMQKVA